MASRDEITRRRRVTYQQLESLWEFLNSHRDIAVGYNKTAQARQFSKQMWVSVSEILNSQGEGATKDWKGWSNYWVDYKAKLKRRVAALRISQSRTGGGPSDATPLNDLEKKFLSLLGEGFGAGLLNTQVDPFPTLTQPVQVTEPVAGPSHVQTPSPELQIPLDEDQQPNVPLAEELSTPPNYEVEEMVPPQQEIQQEPREPRGSRRVQQRRSATRQAALSLQDARRTLVDVARSRLALEQQNAESLRRISETQEQLLPIYKEILCTLKKIAAVTDKPTSVPESGNEGAPDS